MYSRLGTLCLGIAVVLFGLGALVYIYLVLHTITIRIPNALERIATSMEIVVYEDDE